MTRQISLETIREARRYGAHVFALFRPHIGARVLEARDRYEAAFRAVVREGIDTGVLRPDLNVKTTSIFVLSILNAIERWYHPTGAIGRVELTDQIAGFVLSGVASD